MTDYDVTKRWRLSKNRQNVKFILGLSVSNFHMTAVKSFVSVRVSVCQMNTDLSVHFHNTVPVFG